jgi:hypothetical protein
LYVTDRKLYCTSLTESCIVRHWPKVVCRPKVALYVTDRKLYCTSLTESSAKLRFSDREVKSKKGSLLLKLATFSDSRTVERASGALRVAVPLPRTANTVIMLGIVEFMDFKHGLVLKTNILCFRDRISRVYQGKKLCLDCSSASRRQHN